MEDSCLTKDYITSACPNQCSALNCMHVNISVTREHKFCLKTHNFWLKTINSCKNSFKILKRIEMPNVQNRKKKNPTNLVDQSKRILVDIHPKRDPVPLMGCPELRARWRESIFCLIVGTARLSAYGSRSSSRHRLTRETQPDKHLNCISVKILVSPIPIKKRKDKWIRSLNAPHHRFIQWLTGLLSCNIIICLCCQWKRGNVF